MEIGRVDAHASIEAREIETKFTVPPGAAFPDLAGLPGVASIDDPVELTLEAVYLDTPDLRLARARTTLRRRTGGTDAGWHLKLPVSSDERTELQLPLGPADGEVPPELVTAIRARVREAPLAPVVTLRTHRTVRRLRDAAGRILAEVADDAVTSSTLGDCEAVVDAWREWEVELVEGDRDLLAAATALLTAAGGDVPPWSSKLARALGGRLTLAAETADRASARTGSMARIGSMGTGSVGTGSVGALLRDTLRAQRDDLLARDPRARRDEPDSVHQLRVATRRLRSTLTTFRPYLARERSEPVRAELGWLAGLLGAARDAEVARDRFAELVAQEPVELVLGPVARRLDADRGGAYRAAHDVVLVALDTTRYFRLLDTLDALVIDPPLTGAAAAKAARDLPPRVRREYGRLARAMRTALDAAPGPHRDELLHEARKSAKRTRYAAEAVTIVAGRPAARFARATESLQTLLGDHHDTVELRTVLRRVGVQAHLDGENAFTYGRLHALEQARAERLEVALPAAWDRVSGRRRRRWLR